MPPPHRPDDFDPADPTDPDLADIIDPSQTNFAPGDYCWLDRPTPLPAAFWRELKSVVVHIKRVSDNKTWDLHSQALPFAIGPSRRAPRRVTD